MPWLSWTRHNRSTISYFSRTTWTWSIFLFFFANGPTAEGCTQFSKEYWADQNSFFYQICSFINPSTSPLSHTHADLASTLKRMRFISDFKGLKFICFKCLNVFFVENMKCFIEFHKTYSRESILMHNSYQWLRRCTKIFHVDIDISAMKSPNILSRWLPRS